MGVVAITVRVKRFVICSPQPNSRRLKAGYRTNIRWQYIVASGVKGGYASTAGRTADPHWQHPCEEAIL